MTTTPSQTTSRHLLGLFLLLGASYVICIGACALCASLSRFDHLEGALDGLFFSILLGTLPWLFILAPSTGVIYYACRRRERFRAWLTLTPSLLVALLIFSTLLIVPPTTANQFRRLTEHALPKSAHDVRAYDLGGGFDGVETTFFFRCTAGDTEELIRVLDLRPSDARDQPSFYDRPDATWPDPRSWPDRKLYSKERLFVESGPRPPDLNYYLCTDDTHAQVYLAVAP